MGQPVNSLILDELVLSELASLIGMHALLMEDEGGGRPLCCTFHLGGEAI
jgi:hypothetical protein